MSKIKKDLEQIEIARERELKLLQDKELILERERQKTADKLEKQKILEEKKKSNEEMKK